jgi:murein DD-endopeptidase MepM/ murein hydrolase activator NlpD
MIVRWIVIFMLLSVPAQAGKLGLECPQSIGIGLPFTVRVESDVPLDRLRVDWAGKSMQFSVGAVTSAEVLLGTDVLHSKPGAELLRVVKLGLNPLAVQTSVQIERRKFPEQRLTVPEAMATPPASVQDRIARENALVRETLARVSPVNHLTLPLIRPVPGRVTSAYGLTRFFNDKPRNPHRGLDLDAGLGEPVQAAAPGQVVLADDHYYAGRCVFIDHGWGVHTVYMHLDGIEVRQGDMVEAGQTIGPAGQTGRVTAPHLHFGLSILDLSVDPTSLFFQAP